MTQPAFDFDRLARAAQGGAGDWPGDPDDDAPVDDGGEPTFGVGELVQVVNGVLRRTFPAGVWVRGEIQGWQRRGEHAYFTLCEDGEQGKAVISVALFAPTMVRLRPLLSRHRLKMADGVNVRIHGALDYYAPTGRVSLKVDDIDPTFTLGQLTAGRDALLAALTAEGLLEANSGLPLPAAPLRLGLVTSRQSAAWHDLVDELRRSGIGFRLAACDVRVQGDDAPRQVARAVTSLGRRGVDVVLVVRGGGARTELATFDSEPIARAIAACPVPVLTGLGHEIDRSVADAMAHTALKTPTACAQFVVARVREQEARAEAAWERVAGLATRRVERATERLDGAARRTAGRASAQVDLAHQRAEHAERRLRREVDLVLAGAAARTERAAGRIEGAGRRGVADAARALDLVAARVGAVDPALALARGWSITRGSDGRVLHGVGGLQVGDRLVTDLAGGRVTSRVEEVEGG